MTIEAAFQPLPTLQTERLILRALVPDDAAAMFAYAADPDVARYTSWPPHASLDETRRMLDLMLAQTESGIGPWGIVEREKQQLLGTISVINLAERHFRAELGYALARQAWGRGYTTEATRAVLDFCFRATSLNRIEARCIVENVGSARVMEKAGMRYEGLLRQQMYIKGAFQDLKLYAMLREDWAERAMSNPVGAQ